MVKGVYTYKNGSSHLQSNASLLDIRLMTMSLLYPCGKPCSTGTHNETVKKLTLFSKVINGITASNLNPVGVFSVPQSNRKFYHICSVTIVIHKSHNLVGTLGIAEFGPK